MPDSDAPSTTSGTLRGGIFIKRVPSPYTKEQVTQYLRCVGYPGANSDDAVQNHQNSLGNLTRLMRLHLLTFPFENTAMHYTKEHKMDVSFQGAFERLVSKRMGSYCFGQNSVMLGILRGLGYRVYPGLARVNMSYRTGGDLDYTSQIHILLFVQPIEGSNQTYVVDVGFGSPCLSRPILLSEDNPSPGSMDPEFHRLIQAPHPQSSLDTTDTKLDRTDFLWRLEMFHKSSNGSAVSPVHRSVMYTFSENEAFPVDFEEGSFAVSQMGRGLFWDHVVTCRHVLLKHDKFVSNSESKRTNGDATPHHPDGAELVTIADDDALVRYTLFGSQVKRNAGSESTVIRELKSDAERIQALREVFGLNIPDEAEEYIQGRPPAFSSAKALQPEE